MSKPQVSIGVPVFNGEAHLRQALDSLLAQTFTDFELIISDNASTDRTGEICLEYAQKDPRIRYVRQPENRGAGFNFQFVLDEARGGYFMWVAHDDVRSPDFIAVNADFLSRNPDFVASTSPVRFNDDEFDETKMGDTSLVGNAPQRIVQFFRGRWGNGRFYSLIRRETIKDFNLTNAFLGIDWALVLCLASKGKLNRTIEGSVVLRRSGFSNSKNVFRVFRKSPVFFFFPFYRLSLYTLGLSKGFSIRDKSKIVWALLKINIKGFILQFVVPLRRSGENRCRQASKKV